MPNVPAFVCFFLSLTEIIAAPAAAVVVVEATTGVAVVVCTVVGPAALLAATPTTQHQMQTHTTMGATIQNRMKKVTLRPIASPRSTKIQLESE